MSLFSKINYAMYEFRMWRAWLICNQNTRSWCHYWTHLKNKGIQSQYYKTSWNINWANSKRCISSCTQDSSATAVMMKAGVIFLGLYCIFSTVLGQEESTGGHQDGKCTKIAPYVLSNSLAEWKLYYINQKGRFITISIYSRI